MKKILLLIISLVLALSVLVSCGNINSGGNETPDGNDEIPGDELPGGDNGGSDGLPDGEKPDDNGNNSGNPDDNGNDSGNPDDMPGSTHTYIAFTPDEKALFEDIVGFVIPFVANNEYYVEDYAEPLEDGIYEKGINFYTCGNTKSEFDAYKALFSQYENDGSDVDEYGDTWYFFSKGEVYVDMSFYNAEGEDIIDVYVYLWYEDSTGGDSGSTGGDSGNDDVDDVDRQYTAFTAEEKKLFTDSFGFVIPFIPNDEYYVEDYYQEYDDGTYDEGLSFYTFGNNESEFIAYKEFFSQYTNDGTDTDDDGDTWYFFSKGDVYIDMSYYYYENEYVVDVYVYYICEDDGTGGDSGSTGGDSGNSGSTDDVDLITNAGAGLPDGTDGVFNVDFTTATNVKDVTDQGYYIDGCPTVGTPGVLVIPVQFSDVTAASKGFEIDTIKNAFEKDGDTDYYSVYDYYLISSYGKLSLNVEVLDEWFTPKYASSYYLEATYDYYGDEVAIGDQLVLNEALAYLEPLMDLSAYDSDNNGIIDAVILVNTLDINSDSDFNWAYRYWNVYTDDEGYYYEYDQVSANDYLWMSCGFLHEEYDEEGNVSYDNLDVLNTYTAIHEFGHVLGADDYYDTSYNADEGPMSGCDIMDSMCGDHNAYSKFNYGWITSSRLVVAEQSVTLTLEKFSKNGDTIIIANNWDPTLGAYQEYYVLAYYTMEELNGGDYGYFSRGGIVVYHVNASLYSEEIDGETYYDVYNNNTDPSDDYGTADNLIEYVLSNEETYTYVEGNSLPSVTDDQGNRLCYSFTVDAIGDDAATITIYRV